MERLASVAAHTYQPPLPAGLWRKVVARIALMFERARTRQHLAELNEQQLADIGISHSERLAELDRPFWR
ncbi:hypothetical protein D3C76_1252370 [compost metagenome]